MFERSRYTFAVKEDVGKNAIVGSVNATSTDSGKYFLCSGVKLGYVKAGTGRSLDCNLFSHQEYRIIF
jgi:hypothetical protein